MKRRLALAALACAALWSLPAAAGDLFDGIMPLAMDEHAALAAVKATPGKHVLLYFGDNTN